MPFHGRGRGGKRHLQRRFLRKRGTAGNELSQADGVRPLSQNLTVLPDSPFCRCATSSPGAGEVFPQRESLWRNHTLCDLTRNFSAMPRPLPLGEVDLRSKDGEGEDATQSARGGHFQSFHPKTGGLCIGETGKKCLHLGGFDDKIKML